MPLTQRLIDATVARYQAERGRHDQLTQKVASLCRDTFRRSMIRGAVQFRSKHPDHLRRKLCQLAQRPEETAALENVEDVLARIHDLAGVRVTTYVEHDRRKVVALLQERFRGPAGAADIEVEVKDRLEGEHFYRATHCQVVLRDEDVPGEAPELAGLACEVQVCSMLAHVWNEIEHDLAYKPLTGELSRGERDILTSMGQLFTAGDTLINLLLRANEARLVARTGVFTDAFDFVARMRGAFPEASRFPVHAAELLEALRLVGLDTPVAVEEALLGDDAEERSEARLAELSQSLEAAGPTALRLDPASSDRLLVLLLAARGDELTHHLGPEGALGERVAALLQVDRGAAAARR